MGKTRRDIPTRKIDGEEKELPFRKVQTFSTQKLEMQAADQSEDVLSFGVELNNRVKVRANPKSGAIPSDYDDVNIAAHKEDDYRNHPKFKEDEEV